MIPKDALKAAMATVREDLQNPLHWIPRRIATRVINAAGPFLRAQALEDAADELVRLERIGKQPSVKTAPEDKAAYYAYSDHDGDHSAWLRTRAAMERGQA